MLLAMYEASFGLEKCHHPLPFSTILLISFHETEVAVYVRIQQSLLSSFFLNILLLLLRVCSLPF